jgi:hypothetical protein
MLTVWINFYFFPIACCFALIYRTFKAGRLSLSIASRSVADVALIAAFTLVRSPCSDSSGWKAAAVGFGEYYFRAGRRGDNSRCGSPLAKRTPEPIS